MFRHKGQKTVKVLPKKKKKQNTIKVNLGDLRQGNVSPT